MAAHQRGDAPDPASRRRAWLVVALLFAAGFVNFLDRSTLSIANRSIAEELHLSPSEMGALLSVFAWAYALLQLPAGALADRLGPRVTLAAGMLAWSVAQIGSGVVRTFGPFLVARAALGAGESPMFTGGARAIVTWFPPNARGAPLGLFNAASSLAPAVAPPLLTPLMLAFGWRPMFILMGVLGLVVAAAWILVYRDPERGLPRRSAARTAPGPAAPDAAVGWRSLPALLRVPSTWAMAGGLFGVVYATWFFVTWLPAYLEDARHLDVASTGWLAAVPQAAGFVGACLGGVLSDGLARLGMAPAASRKLPAVGGLLLAAAFTLASPFAAGTGGALALMSGALFCAYAAGSCSWTLGATLAPANAVATLEAIQNVGGSLGGALAPLATGLIVEKTGSFTLAFVAAALAATLSGISYLVVRTDAYARFDAPPTRSPK